MPHRENDAGSSLQHAPRVIVASPRFLVIEKPAGVLSVPGRGEANQACAASWVRERFPGASGPLTVHRLDMDTSGLLLLALDPETHRAMSRQFEARTVEKSYVALVAGHVAADAGTLDAPLRPDLDDRPRQVVDWSAGRPALTPYRVLERGRGHTRLELTPQTGRTHQLRVHCAHKGPGGLGCPILGDVLYGEPALPPAPRLMLHATRLAFTHPASHQPVVVECPAPF